MIIISLESRFDKRSDKNRVDPIIGKCVLSPKSDFSKNYLTGK
jgi:hypothetical protein